MSVFILRFVSATQRTVVALMLESYARSLVVYVLFGHLQVDGT